MIAKLAIIFIFFWSLTYPLQAQKIEVDTADRYDILVYPIIFYLPETKFGFGGASVITFRLPGEAADSRPSSMNAGMAYTLNKQLLMYFPYKLYKDHNRWLLKGEIGYYVYLYNHFGIGNDSRLEDEETYDVDYPRLHMALSRRFGSLYVGATTRYDNYKIRGVSEGGLLRTDPWARQDGGQLFTVGPILTFDTKDYEFHPSRGFLIELSFIKSFDGFLSDASYTQLRLNAAHYLKIYRETILATNVYYGQVNGDAPFSELFFVGNDKRARGYANRRFKANSLFVMQSELRFPIWKRLEGVAFIASSVLADQPSQLYENDARLSGGGGVRFVINKQDRVRLRLDYAFSEEGSNSYFTVNHAF